MRSEVQQRSTVVAEEEGEDERRRKAAAEEDELKEEYQVEYVRDHGRLQLRSDLRLPAKDSTHREKAIVHMKDVFQGFYIHPKTRWYRGWEKFILLWAVYSCFFTPMEFGFFRGLPHRLRLLDTVGQLAFFIDVFLQFFVAHRDKVTYMMVYNRNLIAIRYLKSHFIDLLACMPWDNIYKASGRKEVVRYLLLIRFVRAIKILQFFSKLEKDERVKYLFSRILKLIAIRLYSTHTAACIFYYLATTLPPVKEEYTWIGSLKLGEYSYSNFRHIHLWKRYITSLFFAVGHGDIHAVNTREMIFSMIYVSFDAILGAYLIGNLTALIVKGSKTEKYRDRLSEVLKYIDRNGLPPRIINQVKGHLRLQYDLTYTDSAVIKDLPSTMRARISQFLYIPDIDKVFLFKGCSRDFINHIVTKMQEEVFLPGDEILEQGVMVDQVYFVCNGMLEGYIIREDGSEERVLLIDNYSSFGDVSILCNITQPYTVRVCELSRLLRLDKQSFTNSLEIYRDDGQTIRKNILEGEQLGTNITVPIAMQEAELALRVNGSACSGDFSQLKSLIQAGADPNKTDHDGRSPMHLAASKGHENIALFLIEQGVDINLSDNFGNTPLLEAIKNGHDNIASLLMKQGGSLKIDDPGSFLCSYVGRGEIDFVRRILSYGLIDPNSKDYAFQTPLHVATLQGSYIIAKLLVQAGADVQSKDRWGNTPLDEARLSGNKMLIKLLEEAKSFRSSEFPSSS